MHSASDTSTVAASCRSVAPDETEPPQRVLLLQGPGSIEALGARFDRLCRETGTPITARRVWLESWIRVHSSGQQLVVAVERGDRLVAAAPLSVHRRLGVAVARPIGDGTSDDVRFPATDQRAADLLATAVRDALTGIGGPWLLVVRHMGPGQPAVPALARALTRSVVMPGDMSPGLTFGPERTLRAHLLSSHRKPLERRHRRLAERHRDVVLQHLTAEADIAACFDDVARVCRLRDRAVGRRSQLDDPEFRAFLEEAVRALSRSGEVELTTLRIGGELAAYALCLLDENARRLYHGRYDPRWDLYAIGHMVNLAALQRGFDDPACHVFDWMRGAEEYKTPLSNHRVQLTDLVACSMAPAWLVRLLPAAIERRRAARRVAASFRRSLKQVSRVGSG